MEKIVHTVVSSTDAATRRLGIVADIGSSSGFFGLLAASLGARAAIFEYQVLYYLQEIDSSDSHAPTYGMIDQVCHDL